MDFVIPVALDELLFEMDILTAAKLNGQRVKAFGFPQAASTWNSSRFLG